MLRKIFLLSIVILSSLKVLPQSGLLDRPDLLPYARQGLSSMYNYDFVEARKVISLFQKEIPLHPATTFFEALVIYWENYPLTIENRNTPEFLRLMDETSGRAEKIVSKNPDDLEGIFFSLFSRSFYVMFWSDNGKPSKVFPYLNFLYRHTIKGMEKKKEFVEFYFSSGLYNYYIEAYPDKHPIFKPVRKLFRQGNKKDGLNDLIFCAENGLYLRVEAKYFLTLLYRGYEKNIRMASRYAGDLYREFPENSCYSGTYAECLLFDRKYPMAEIIIQNLAAKNDTFSRLQYHIYYGYLLEKYKGDYETAFSEYQKGLDLCDSFGEVTNHFRALACMGIGRYYRHNGKVRESSLYFKLAKNNSPYDYLLDDK